MSEHSGSQGIKVAAQQKSQLREWTEAIVIAVVLALFIRTFIVQAYKIPSASMEDTLLIGDHLLVNKFLYGTHIPFTGKKVLPIRQPERGDIIVFKYPNDENIDYIKRVIGLPGDVVEVKDKRVYVNGKQLIEPYVVFKEAGILPRNVQPRDNYGPVTVPPDSMLMMGDNRDRSYDSRFWGFVGMDKIQGKAFIIYWSWNGDDSWVRWGRIGNPIN